MTHFIDTTPPVPASSTVAIIGGGLAGAAAARTLTEQGLDVTVLDKGRGPGGRAATRRQNDLSFDHGAQYFTARDPRFRRFLDAWIDDGVAARWDGRVVRVDRAGVHETGATDRFVGVPGMNAVIRDLLVDVETHFTSWVVDLIRDRGGWRLVMATGEVAGPFTRAVLAVPAPQAAAPLRAAAPGLAARLDSVVMRPCWTMMAAFDSPLEAGFDGAFVEDGGPLGWVARNGSKAARGAAETWVAQASHDWSAARLEDDPETVQAALDNALRRLPGWPDVTPSFARVHRWRYASVATAVGVECCVDAREPDLVVCGDWCLGSRMEAAFLSGVAAAGQVLALPAPAAVQAHP